VRRVVLVLTVVAVLLAAMLTSGLSAVAQDEAPGDPQCGWYLNWEEPEEAWWEYWCWWPGWGWEFVFWVWD
jgi:hypothetical protein